MPFLSSKERWNLCSITAGFLLWSIIDKIIKKAEPITENHAQRPQHQPLKLIFFVF